MADDDRATPADFEPGPSSADALNRIGRGRMFCKTRESSQLNIDGDSVVVSKTYTIAVDGRRYCLEGSVTVRSVTAGGVSLRIFVDGDQVNRVNDAAVGSGKDVTFSVDADIELDSGTYTFELMVARSGAGSNLISALADGPAGSFGIMQLKLTDVSPAMTGS